jgi:hypothetical protein
MTVATDRSQTRARNPHLSATVPPLAAGWARSGGGQPLGEPPSPLILLTDLLTAFMLTSDSASISARSPKPWRGPKPVSNELSNDRHGPERTSEDVHGRCEAGQRK